MWDKLKLVLLGLGKMVARALACELVLLGTALAWAADPSRGLEPGTLPAAWISGGPNCVSVPDWQVHEYNEKPTYPPMQPVPSG